MPSAATGAHPVPKIRDPWDGWGPGAPNSARFFDYLLGGKDHFPVDRDAAEQADHIIGDARQLAAKIRAFSAGATTAAARAGITQFLDIGSGLPAVPDIHDTARAIQPSARVVYVDPDPEVATHSRAFRAGELTGFTQGTILCPGDILASTAVRTLIDFSEPVAVLMTAVLHWCPGGIQQAVQSYKDRCAPGSWLVIAHADSDSISPGRLDRLTSVFDDGPSGFHPRPAAAIKALFSGWRVFAPGLTDVRDWPSPPARPPVRRRLGVPAGIGVKP